MSKTSTQSRPNVHRRTFYRRRMLTWCWTLSSTVSFDRVYDCYTKARFHVSKLILSMTNASHELTHTYTNLERVLFFPISHAELVSDIGKTYIVN